MLKPIEELTFTDDFMFRRVMENPEICKGLLERLLEIKIEKIEYPVFDKMIASYYKSNGIRLEVYVKGESKVLDVEIQNYNEKNPLQNTRWFQSLMDYDFLLKGNYFTEFRESYVIVLCKEDPWGENIPCYTFANHCMEDIGLVLKDKTHKIFYNASSYKREENPEKRAILEYLVDKNPTSDFTKQLDNFVKQTKLNDIFRDNYISLEQEKSNAE